MAEEKKAPSPEPKRSEAPKAKYRLKSGSFLVGSGISRKKYNHGKQGENVIESEQNLAAMHPEKFERLEEYNEGPYAYNPTPREGKEGKTTGPNPNAMPPLTPTTAERREPKGKTLDEQYGDLEALKVEELKNIAEVEEIDIKGAHKKEELIKALRAGK